MRYFFGICKQKRKILTFMCSLFHPFLSFRKHFLAEGHMHHISYRRKKIFSTSSSSTYFFRCFVASTTALISLLMVITIHYKFRSFSFSIAKKTRKIANSLVHISSPLLWFTHFSFGLFFFLPGPENNLISCVL